MKLTTDFSLVVDNEIELKLPTLDMAEALFALTDKNRTFLRRYLGWVDGNKTVHDTHKFIEEDLKLSYEGKSLTLTLLYLGQPVGFVGLHDIDKVNEVGCMGYWIDQDHQGKRIMHRACTKLLNFATGNFHLHRIELRCATDNLRSKQLALSLGFIQEVVLKEALLHYGKRYDAYLFAKIT